MLTDSKRVIIVAESDKDVNQLISGSLKLHGLDIHSAYTEEEYLQQLGELKDEVEAVFINGKLASNRGGLLVSRTRESNPRIKIIVVAENDESDRSQILRYGVDEFIEKPVSSETISAKTLSLLSTVNKVQ